MSKRDEIIDIMFFLFAEKGYNASMSDLAKLVKIKVPSIYSHFSSKDEIILLVIEKEINNYYHFLNQIINDSIDKNANCKETLEAIYFSVIEYFKCDNRLRFWKNISLINNSELRKESKKLIAFYEKANGSLYRSVFENGVKNMEITGENLQGTMYLYLALIRGTLDVAFISEDVVLSIDDFAKMSWKAYWEGQRKR